MAQKVYWLGKKAAHPDLGAPVSKVHRRGLELLKSLGWTEISNASPERVVPVFAFTTRKGANYAADRPDLPPIRQLPHACSACLDDKRRLQQHLQAAGVLQQLMPACWNSLGDYQAHLNSLTRQQGKPAQQQGAAAAAAASERQISSGSGKLPASVFVKHRLGVKGQAVHVCHTHGQLAQLAARLQRSSEQFIVQQEVPPLLLASGCKFVLRAHVLATRLPAGQAAPSPVDPPSPCQLPATAVYLHEDVIVLQHAASYMPGSDDAAVHVSSKGSHHPAPLLLERDLPELQREHELWPQLQRLVARCMAAVAGVLWPPTVAAGVLLYHLFGFDCVVDASGKAVLLEVNSYPAIASGTMGQVDAGVFDRLLRDMVTLMVLPVTDGAPPKPGGFVQLTDRVEQRDAMF